MVVDNWGWATGECRGEFGNQNRPIDASDTQILHPNGGCYDASLLRDNVNLELLTLPRGEPLDETDATLPSRGIWRPWIIFPGSIQVQRAAQ